LVGDPAPALAVAALQPVPPAPEPSVDTQAVTQQMVAVAPPMEPIPPPVEPTPPSIERIPPPTAPASPQRRGPRHPVALAAALAGVALIALLTVAFLDPSRQPTTAVPSSTPTVVPTPTPPPAWLAELVQAYQDACGTEQVTEVTADLAAMTEEEARNHAEELIDGCDDEKPGKGNRKGNGNGGGND
jgi:hypothetical protein